MRSNRKDAETQRPRREDTLTDCQDDSPFTCFAAFLTRSQATRCGIPQTKQALRPFSNFRWNFDWRMLLFNRVRPQALHEPTNVCLPFRH
jgi:hypothetical protein